MMMMKIKRQIEEWENCPGVLPDCPCAYRHEEDPSRSVAVKFREDLFSSWRVNIAIHAKKCDAFVTEDLGSEV